MSSPVLTVRTVTPEQHLDFLRSWTADGGAAASCRRPRWGEVKSEWRRESLGWFDAPTDWSASAWCSTGSCPKVKRYLAYLPEGPVIDWDADDLARLARPDGGAPEEGGRVRRPDGPARGDPALGRRDGQGRRSPTSGVPPARRRAPDATGRRPAPASSRSSRELGWQPQAADGGFAAGQPQYIFQIPLADADGTPRTEDDVLKGMNQLWRRNIKKADKAGVEVDHGTRADLQAFHDALRAHRRARPLHAAAAGLLRDDVRRAGGRGARPDAALPRPPRGRPGRGHHLRPRRRPRLVLLRRLAPPRSATSAAPTRSSGR